MLLLLSTTSSRTSDLAVSGGHNVRIIGGDNGPGRMQFSNITGSVYIEGTKQSLTAHKDAINVLGKAGFMPDIYLQNVYVTGVFGTSTDPQHADILQPQGPVGNIYIQGLTGDSNYQGLFLAGNAGGILSATLSRINLKYNAITPSDCCTFLYWFGDNNAGSPVYPVNILHNVFLAPRSGQTIAQSGVWPQTGVISSSTPLGALDDGSGNAFWPAASLITGKIYTGAPAGGDFVVPGGTGPGINYVSPGYDSAPPVLSSIVSAVTTSSATITWNTDELASTLVSYGPTSAYGNATSETATTSGETTHTVQLAGLTPNTTYHFQVSSYDLSDNQATSSDLTFTTAAIVSNTPAASSGGGGLIYGSGPMAPGWINTNPTQNAVSVKSDSSGISGSQIQSIILLLQSFGADQSVIDLVTASLNGSTVTNTPASPIFTRDLELRDIGSDVKALQQYLNNHQFTVARSGPGSAGNETTIFGYATQAALVQFQKANGIVPAIGYFGPKTRAALGI